MIFKIDENLPSEVAQLLQEAGYPADSVHEEGLAGSADPDIARAVKAENRVLVTLDRGFADIRAYPPAEFAGIILLRPRNQGKPGVLSLCKTLIGALSIRSPQRELWTMEPGRIRFHGRG